MAFVKNKRQVPIRITVPEGKEWGPAMSALNDRQKAFIIAAYTIGGSDHTAWALAAGYSDNGSSMITVQASRMMHNPKILAAMREYADLHFQNHMPELVGLLMKIARTGTHKDQMKAITHAMALSGLQVIEKKEVEHKHTVTVIERWKRVVELAKANGEDPKALLANLTKEEREAVEAEWEEVPDGADVD